MRRIPLIAPSAAPKPVISWHFCATSVGSPCNTRFGLPQNSVKAKAWQCDIGDFPGAIGELIGEVMEVSRSRQSDTANPALPR